MAKSHDQLNDFQYVMKILTSTVILGIVYFKILTNWTILNKRWLLGTMEQIVDFNFCELF